jgi:hypothetical protein
MEADEVYFERLDDVLVIAAQIRERRPPLSLPVHSLALIFADGATCRWPHGPSVFNATAYTNIVDHTLLNSPNGPITLKFAVDADGPSVRRYTLPYRRRTLFTIRV